MEDREPEQNNILQIENIWNQSVPVQAETSNLYENSVLLPHKLPVQLNQSFRIFEFELSIAISDSA